MAPSFLPGEPKESPKPDDPMGSQILVFLITTCTLCGLFLLWRRAGAIRKVVSHRLKNVGRPEGRIRLSEDDGPAATEFLGDDYDDDNEHVSADIDAEALAEQMKRATQAWSEPSIAPPAAPQPQLQAEPSPLINSPTSPSTSPPTIPRS